MTDSADSDWTKPDRYVAGVTSEQKNELHRQKLGRDYMEWVRTKNRRREQRP